MIFNNVILTTYGVDNKAIMVTLLGMAVVFSGLVILVVMFNMFPKAIKWFTRWQLRKQGKILAKNANLDVPADVIPAIAMALHLYLSQDHDEESNLLTIKRVSRFYSPWSSKIYMVRNQFNRN